MRVPSPQGQPGLVPRVPALGTLDCFSHLHFRCQQLGSPFSPRAAMSNPSAPPPYEDRNPLYPGSPPQGGYGQPSVLPGGYPAYPAYPQPGYGHPAGYPQPMPPIHPMPMHYGESLKGAGGRGRRGSIRPTQDTSFPSFSASCLIPFFISSLVLSSCLPIFVNSPTCPLGTSPPHQMPASPLFGKETESTVTHQNLHIR